MEARVHRSVAFGASLGLLVQGQWIGWESAAALAAGCLFGEVWLSPDLDLGAGARAYRWWPWPLRLVWLVYARCVWHRSPMSHWPILGTAGRLLVLAVPAAIALVISGLDVSRITPDIRALARMAVIGIELSAWLHLLADRVR